MKGSFTLFCTDSFQRCTESIGWSPRLWQESTSNCLSTSSHCPMLWWKFIVFAVLALPKLAKLWISTKIGGPGHLESPNLATIWVCCWALLLFGCSYSHWCAFHSPLPWTPLYWTRNQWFCVNVEFYHFAYSGTTRTCKTVNLYHNILQPSQDCLD